MDTRADGAEAGFWEVHCFINIPHLSLSFLSFSFRFDILSLFFFFFSILFSLIWASDLYHLVFSFVSSATRVVVYFLDWTLDIGHSLLFLSPIMLIGLTANVYVDLYLVR